MVAAIFVCAGGLVKDTPAAILSNGDFEGGFYGSYVWGVSGEFGNGWLPLTGPGTGVYAADSATLGFGTLSGAHSQMFAGAGLVTGINQAFPTTPGAKYCVSFQYRVNDPYGMPWYVWDGSIGGTPLIIDTVTTAGTATGQFTALSPTTVIDFRNSQYTWFAIDNVSVVGAPEPGSAVLMVLGLTVTAWWTRRTKA